jgi:hypothetical protein
MLLSFISILSPLFPILLGAKRNRRSYIWWYAWAGMIADLVVFFLKHICKQPTAWVSNVFVITEFVLILLYFSAKVFRFKIFPLLVMMGTGLIFFAFTTFYFKGPFKVNLIGISVLNVIYIILCVLGYYRILKEQQIVHLEKYSGFWIISGIFIYASGSFFLFLEADALTAVNAKLMMMFWLSLFAPLNTLKNILLGIGLSKSE